MDQRQESRDHKPQGPEPDHAVAQATGPWSLVSGPWSRAQRDRGFALLVTITLLAFIVLLLLGLAAYTRVETAAAGNTQRQAQARENALFALHLALGQLQKYAGPDQRVTATAETFTPAPVEEGEEAPNVNVQKVRYTGVWHTDPAATNDSKTPLAWLASGIETGTPVDVTEAIPAARRAVLVGARTDGSATANNTVAALQDITSTGVPGVSPTAPAATIGRYAWWIGDQGVKAPVAAYDSISNVDYAPYDSADLRERIRQQIALGAGAADANGAAVFEPRDTNNAPLVANQKVAAINQIAFLRNASNTQLGLTRVQQNFHTWSPNNYAVIANTKLGGLRQDLSLKPELLGEGFVRWTNYAEYMEEPTNAVSTETASGESDSSEMPGGPPLISPPYGSDPIRRRYKMQPPVSSAGVQHSIAPVLGYFLLSFSVGTQNNSSAASAPIEVRARWMMSFWNPYTAALVPENLRVEVEGLPMVELINDTTGATDAVVPLESLYTSVSPNTQRRALRVLLPWDSTNGTPDHQSWFPGRVHTWAALPDPSGSTPDDGHASLFDTRDVSATATTVAVRRVISTLISGKEKYSLTVTNPTVLTMRLYSIREGGDVLLKTFTSPQFNNFTTTPDELNKDTYQFSYLFRLAESIDTPDAPETWLLGPRRDPRRISLAASAFVAGPNGPHPELYPTWRRIDDPDRLLNRDDGSFDKDVPLFELPRSPILSVGMLQHLPRSNRRAFGIGNSWGRFGTLNGVPIAELFDRFFFSGLVADATPTTTSTGDMILPNPLLKPLRNADGTKPTIDDVRRTVIIPGTEATETTDATEPTPSPADARSSKYFLQGGAFNLNSTNSTAWSAVLRSVRFPTIETKFVYLEADPATGTAGDLTADLPPSSDARFFRFSQSAQETYKTADGNTSVANSANFRKGMRTLTSEQVTILADRITGLIRARHAALGPFRSLEEFLQPLPDSIVEDDEGEDEEPPPDAPPPTIVASFGQSLLERAIANADINSGLEFSSQWLTQADLMTALAPILFPRSDTFVIRAYGEAVNPATSATEGRAWCEAIVQRLPEYVDPSLPPEALPSAFEPTVDPDNPDAEPASTQAQRLNQALGRRFKVVSFRWLTRSDI